MKRENGFNDSSVDLMAYGAAYIYLVLMLLVFPLYHYDGFNGLNGKKIVFFVAVTGIFGIICLFPFIRNLYFCHHEIWKKKWLYADIAAICFWVSICLSGVVSIDRQEMFFPTVGKRIGFFVMFLCVMAYFCVKSYAKFDAILLWCYLLGSGGIFLWGILLNCKVNLFHIQETFYLKEEMAIYVSPIGNINYNAAFLALTLPAAMAMYLTCKEQFTKNVLSIYLFLGFLDMVLLRSDSIYPAMAAVFCVLFYFALGGKEYFRRFCQMTCLLFLAGIVTFLLYRWIPDRMYVMEGIGSLFLEPSILSIEVIIILICCLVGRNYSPKEEICHTLQKIWLLFVVAAVLLFVIFLLCINVFFQEKAVGTFWEPFVLTDTFGHGRGYIWRRIPKVYMNIPWKNKLFGCGLNCFSRAVVPYYREEMLSIDGIVFYGAHNECLNLLIETGIVGTVSYFGLIFGTFAHAVKGLAKKPMNIAVIATICSYLVQGLVNDMTIFTLPLFFIFLGCANSSSSVLEE